MSPCSNVTAAHDPDVRRKRVTSALSQDVAAAVARKSMATRCILSCARQQPSAFGAAMLQAVRQQS